MEDHVREFHELTGDTESDYLKNFNLYLKNLTAAGADLVELVGSVAPKTLQEEILVAKMQLKYGTDEQLLQTFVKSDRIIGRVLLKSRRFVKLFLEMRPEDFVTNVCPRISFVARNNLLYKLCYCIEDAEFAERFFGILAERYGLKIATALLVACGEAFVEDVLTTKSVQLSNRQLTHLHKRHPRLVEVYFGESRNFSGYNSFAQYLCMNDSAMFRRLLEYGTPKIGRRAFVKFISEFKDDVIKKPGLLLLRHDVMYKCLSKDDFATYFRNLFLDHVSDFESDSGGGGVIESCLKAVPSTSRGELLFDAFESAYGFPMYSVDDYLKHDVLQELALEDRLKFNLTPDQVEMRDVNSAIAAIKTKLNLTQKLDDRAALAEKLVLTCKLNNDADALLEVLRYFCGRHKNDSKGVRTAFVNKLENTFKIRRLSDEHCGYILELLLNFHLNDEYYYSPNIWEDMFRVKFDNGADYLPLIKDYFKVNGYHCSFNLAEYPEHEKACIVHYSTIISDIYKEEYELKHAKLYFLGWIGEFNRRNPKHEICFYDYFEFLEVLIAEYEVNEYHSSECVLVLARQVPRNEAERNLYEKIMRLHIKSHYKYEKNKVLLWLVKHNPSVVAKCEDIFFEHPAIPMRPELYYNISKMRYAELAGRLRKCAVNVVADHSSADHEKVCACVDYLSFDETYDFAELAGRILPSTDDCKVDVNDDSIRETLALHKHVLKSLKNRRSVNVELVLRFCKGDYLQHALKPLYFALFNSPEDRFLGPASELCTKAVSVRKHGLYLATSLGKPEHVYTELKRWGENEKDASLRKFVFKTTFVKFVELQTDSAWELLKLHVALLDADDKESVDMLLKFEKIPRSYLSEYAKFVWTHLSEDGRLKLFDAISDDVFGKLDPEFRQDLMATLIVTGKKGPVCNRFLRKYLESGGNVDVVLRACSERLNAGLLSGEVRLLYDAFESACLDKKPAPFLPELLAKLSHYDFNVHKLQFRLLFDVALAFTAEPTLKTLAASLLQQHTELIFEFGDKITHFHGEFAKRTVLKLVDLVKGNKANLQLELAENILELKESEGAKQMCLYVLPSVVFTNEKLRKRHEGIVEKIRHGQSMDVDLMAFNYLRECS